MAHTIQPRRQGRWVTCGTVVDGEVCGLMVQHVRHKVRRSFWRHHQWHGGGQSPPGQSEPQAGRGQLLSSRRGLQRPLQHVRLQVAAT